MGGHQHSALATVTAPLPMLAFIFAGKLEPGSVLDAEASLALAFHTGRLHEDGRALLPVVVARCPA
jgi:hypothetical protein